MNKTIRFLSLLALVGSISIGGTAQAGVLDCKLKFTMSGWSIFYKRDDGTGTITCSNGQSMAVKLRARGGGISAGISGSPSANSRSRGSSRQRRWLARPPEAGGEFGAKKEDLCRVIQPQQQRGE